MKKTILTLTASLLISAAAVFAQDTTQNQQQQRERYRTEGMVEVQRADLPAVLTETLQDSKYKGWEQGTIYLDPESGEYVLEIAGAGETPQQYRFDRNGTDISEGRTGDQMNQNQDQNAEEQEQDQDVESDTTQREGNQDQNQYNQNEDAQQESDTTQQEGNQDQNQYNRDEQSDTTQLNRDEQNVEGERNQDDAAVTETDTTNMQHQEGEQHQQDQSTQPRQDSAQVGDERDSMNEGAEKTEDVEKSEDKYSGKDVSGKSKSGLQYVEFQVNELPEAVVSKLNEDKYKGWKNNTVYVDTHTGDYIVQADATSGEKDGKYYRINKEGKDISRHNKSKNGQ